MGSSFWAVHKQRDNRCFYHGRPPLIVAIHHGDLTAACMAKPPPDNLPTPHTPGSLSTAGLSVLMTMFLLQPSLLPQLSFCSCSPVTMNNSARLPLGGLHWLGLNRHLTLEKALSFPLCARQLFNLVRCPGLHLKLFDKFVLMVFLHDLAAPVSFPLPLEN